jgi:hypothetical protein
MTTTTVSKANIAFDGSSLNVGFIEWPYLEEVLGLLMAMVGLVELLIILVIVG